MDKLYITQSVIRTRWCSSLYALIIAIMHYDINHYNNNNNDYRSNCCSHAHIGRCSCRSGFFALVEFSCGFSLFCYINMSICRSLVSPSRWTEIAEDTAEIPARREGQLRNRANISHLLWAAWTILKLMKNSTWITFLTRFVRHPCTQIVKNVDLRANFLTRIKFNHLLVISIWKYSSGERDETRFVLRLTVLFVNLNQTFETLLCPGQRVLALVAAELNSRFALYESRGYLQYDRLDCVRRTPSLLR